MGLLLNLAARVLLQPPVEVAAHVCLHQRLPRSTCRRCLEVCPAQALRLEGRTIRLDPLACEGCGLCQGACWSGVFAMKKAPTPTMAQERAVRLTCSGDETQAQDGVPCLGALDPGRLAELAAGRELVLAPRRQCRGCPWEAGKVLAQANLEVALRSLANSGVPGSIGWEEPSVARRDPQEAGTDLGTAQPSPTGLASVELERRELFQGLGAGLRRVVAEALPTEAAGHPDVGIRLRRLAEKWSGRGSFEARS